MAEDLTVGQLKTLLSRLDPKTIVMASGAGVAMAVLGEHPHPYVERTYYLSLDSNPDVENEDNEIVLWKPARPSQGQCCDCGAILGPRCDICADAKDDHAKGL